MFKSYQYIKYLGHNEKSGKYKNLIKIIDDDFEKKIITNYGYASDASISIATIIQIYKNNNLVSNFFLFLQYIEKYYNWKIKDQIDYYLKYVPEYQEIHLQIQKYLNLL